MNRGFFITLEGIDGSGKSTQIARLAQWIEGQGYPVTVTREPGGTPVGESIRQILLDVDNGQITPMTEMLLFAAARAQHVTQVIAPALDAGYVVLCDRFLDSSIAYQASARGLKEEDVLAVNLLAVQGVMPDLTLFLDIDPEEGFKRQLARSDAANRLDRENIAFYRQVRAGFLSLMERDPGRIVQIDGGRAEDLVFADACRAITRLLKSPK